MATAKGIEEALVNADRAGDTQAATALANELVKMRGIGRDPQFRESQQYRQQRGEMVDAAMVPLVAAGKSASDVVEGVKQLGLGANVAARQAVGADSGEQLRAMAAQEARLAEEAKRYQPLREEHPFLTGAGENAYLGAAPVGQVTAMARVGIPTIAGALKGALSPGGPQERAINAVQSGGEAALGGVGGEVVRRAISPVQSAVSGAQQQALRDLSQKIGYPLRPSELTGSESLRRIEDTLSRMPGGAGPMRDMMDTQRAAVSTHASKAMGESGRATQDTFANAATRIGDEYNDLRSRATMPVTQDVFDAVKRAETLLSRGDKVGPKKDALETISRLKDELYQTKQFDGATYQAWTSDLAAKARELGKTNATAAAALREVEKAMDKTARGLDAPRWSAADKQHASKETLSKPGVVNTETGDVSLLKLAANMERQFGRNLKAGKVPDGELFDLYRLARLSPPMAEGSQTAGREAFSSIPAWLTAAPTYAGSKLLTSEFMRDYLSRGLLANPGVSSRAGGLLGSVGIPLTIAEIETLLLQ